MPSLKDKIAKRESEEKKVAEKPKVERKKKSK